MIGKFLIEVAEDSNLAASGIEVERLSQEELRYIGRYGEQEYVDEHVLKGAGRKYLPMSLAKHWDGTEKIRDMSSASASIIVAAVIDATAETSKIIPISTGVGGRPRIFLLDGKSSPKDLSPR